MTLQPDSTVAGRWVNPAWKPGTAGAFAVVIGISQYSHLNGSSDTFDLDQLAVSAHTAGRFFRWLDAHYRLEECPLASCRLLLSPTQEEAAADPELAGHAAPATLDQCELAVSAWYEEMRALSGEAADQSRSYFFFSGHGLEVLQERQILLPSDYLDPARPGKNRALSTENLTRGLAGLAVPNHFFFIDACRTDHQNLGSQEPLLGREILDRPLTRASNPRWYAPVFYSCGANASSFQPRNVSDGLSIFGEALLDGLYARSDDLLKKANNRWEVHPEPLRAFAKRRVREILRERYKGMYTQDVRPVLSDDCPVTAVEIEGAKAEAASAARFEPLGEVLDFQQMAPNIRAPHPAPAKFAIRPVHQSEAFRVIDSEFASRIWAESVEVFDLATGGLLGPKTDFLIDRVAYRRISGMETFRSLQLDIRMEHPFNHHWLKLDDGSLAFGMMLPGDVQLPRFIVEMDHDHPLPATPDGPHPPRHLTRLTVQLSAESAGALSNAAQIWQTYDAIGTQSAVAEKDLGRLEVTLEGKTDSPLGALIAGLILLRARAWPRLHDWLRNLANWFETIPDGPIVWNEQQLLQHRLDPADPEILAGLWTLESRGLPFTGEAFGMAERQVRDALAAMQSNSAEHERLRRLAAKIGTALRYFRPGGLFAVFAGPREAMGPDLVRF